MVVIRREQDGDVEEIRAVNLAAFDGPTEANLVDMLRERGKLVVSLVALSDGAVVGHITFSDVHLASAPHLRGAGLGPMAVLLELQRKRIGSELVVAGLNACRRAGYDFAVVLGHATYYPRFGFSPARVFGMRCEWEVPEDVFMAMELRPNALAYTSGLVTYQPEFREV